MGKWKLVLDESVLHFFASCQANDRRRLLLAFESLRNDPNRTPDFRSRDAGGRPLSLCAVRPFLITYWLDPYVEEIRILNVRLIRP